MTLLEIHGQRVSPIVKQMKTSETPGQKASPTAKLTKTLEIPGQRVFPMLSAAPKLMTTSEIPGSTVFPMPLMTILETRGLRVCPIVLLKRMTLLGILGLKAPQTTDRFWGNRGETLVPSYVPLSLLNVREWKEIAEIGNWQGRRNCKEFAIARWFWSRNGNVQFVSLLLYLMPWQGYKQTWIINSLKLSTLKNVCFCDVKIRKEPRPLTKCGGCW